MIIYNRFCSLPYWKESLLIIYQQYLIGFWLLRVELDNEETEENLYRRTRYRLAEWEGSHSLEWKYLEARLRRKCSFWIFDFANYCRNENLTRKTNRRFLRLFCSERNFRFRQSGLTIEWKFNVAWPDEIIKVAQSHTKVTQKYRRQFLPWNVVFKRVRQIYKCLCDLWKTIKQQNHSKIAQSGHSGL